MLVAAPGVM